jgi:hypothetical protein
LTRPKPHVACFTIDSNHAPGKKVLRSDVHYAIELVKFQLEKGEHTNHHTKPVIFILLFGRKMKIRKKKKDPRSQSPPPNSNPTPQAIIYTLERD